MFLLCDFIQLCLKLLSDKYLLVDNIIFGTGIGKSKKEAEQNAAKDAIKKAASGNYEVKEGFIGSSAARELEGGDFRTWAVA